MVDVLRVCTSGAMVLQHEGRAWSTCCVSVCLQERWTCSTRDGRGRRAACLYVCRSDGLAARGTGVVDVLRVCMSSGAMDLQHEGRAWSTCCVSVCLQERWTCSTRDGRGRRAACLYVFRSDGLAARGTGVVDVLRVCMSAGAMDLQHEGRAWSTCCVSVCLQERWTCSTRDGRGRRAACLYVFAAGAMDLRLSNNNDALYNRALKTSADTTATLAGIRQSHSHVK